MSARGTSVEQAAVRVTRALRRQARPAGAFDPSRYFRTTEALEFLNVRTPVVRAIGRDVARQHLEDWSVDDAVALTERARC